MILPKHLLTAAMSGSTTDYEHLLRDNYETPLYAPNSVAASSNCSSSR